MRATSGGQASLICAELSNRVESGRGRFWRSAHIRQKGKRGDEDYECEGGDVQLEVGAVEDGGWDYVRGYAAVGDSHGGDG